MRQATISRGRCIGQAMRQLIFMLGCCSGVVAYGQAAVPDTHNSVQRREASEATTSRTRPAEVEGKLLPASKHGPEIVEAVENELNHDPLVAPGEVFVTARDGVVTLSGALGSLLAKDRAEHLAETVKGVIEVRNAIRVELRSSKSPNELEFDIVRALLTDPATEAFQIRVEAGGDGAVVLTGEVDSWAERELAERIARGVSGVIGVANLLDVGARPIRSDAELQAEIRRMLARDTYLEDESVSVDVNDGIVALSGAVGSAAERRRAKTLAGVVGVVHVNASSLEVRPDGPRRGNVSGSTARAGSDEQLSNADVAAAVRIALASNPVTSIPGLDVQVRDGIVTLRGEARTLRSKRAALLRAQDVRGVRRVRDHLRLAADPSSSQGDLLSKRILAALSASPLTEAYKIAVSVHGGTVTLAGSVDSMFERAAADDVAAGVSGVLEVNNLLDVRRGDPRLTFDPNVDAWSIHDFIWYRQQRTAPRNSDSAIADAIRREFDWSPFVHSADIQVSVNDGIATLTGDVDSAAEARAARENALEGGAVEVFNRLRDQN